MRYVSKCRFIGKHFTRFNEMTERWEYLYLQHSSRDTFTQSWSRISTKEVAANEKQEDPKKPEPKKKAKKGEKNDKEGDPEEEPKELPRKKAKKLVDILMQRATKTKNRYFQVTGKAQAFQARASSDEDYAWISPKLLEPIEKAKANLHENTSDFALSLFSAPSIQDAKRFHEESELEKLLQEVPDINQHIDTLENEVNRLQRMHAAGAEKAEPK